ncbi:hypothetical protein Hanom_Chr06g00548991 [Helianthus anomalus]
MGGLSPLYPIRPKAFHENQEKSLWSLLQADCKGISFVVQGVVNPKMGCILGEALQMLNSPPVENVRSGDEDLGTRLYRKCKANPVDDVNATVPVPRSILFSYFTFSSVPPPPPSFFIVQVSSKAPIVIPAAPASSQAKGKSPEVSVAPADRFVKASHVQDISQSRFKLPECFQARSL